MPMASAQRAAELFQLRDLSAGDALVRKRRETAREAGCWKVDVRNTFLDAMRSMLMNVNVGGFRPVTSSEHLNI